MTFSVEAGGQLALIEEAKRLELTKGVRGMPAVKPVILVIIVTGEFSSETQCSIFNSACVFQPDSAMGNTAGQAAGKKQVTASNSISLHNRKPEKRWYSTNACVLPF